MLTIEQQTIKDPSGRSRDVEELYADVFDGFDTSAIPAMIAHMAENPPTDSSGQVSRLPQEVFHPKGKWDWSD